MTAPEVFQVRDGDGWEVYVTNPAGGWWLLGDVGGTAVVHTLPDGAEAMGDSALWPRVEQAIYATTVSRFDAEFVLDAQCHKRGCGQDHVDMDALVHLVAKRIADTVHGELLCRFVSEPDDPAEGGDRRG